MKKIQTQLKTMANALSSLSKQVDKLAKHVDKMAKDKPAPKPKKKTAPAKSTRTKATPKAVAVKKKAPAKAPAVKKKAAAATAKPASVIDSVMEHVAKSRNGITIAKLKEKTGLQSRQVSNALYKLAKKGAVEAKTRGLYVKKK